MLNKEMFFHTQNFVDDFFSKSWTSEEYDNLPELYLNKLIELDNNDFESLLIVTGYIPDMYASDSTEETVFSKMVEVIVCAWAQKMGFESNTVKVKASFEDVDICINNKIVVCDAKSFRLGRSQAAPNVKDFLKLEDYRKWLNRYDESKRLGGLVAFPSKHEWEYSSDAYQYCSTKDMPVLMLPYELLALIFHFKKNYDFKTLENLWNYSEIFPDKLLKEMDGGNKAEYWKRIKKELKEILKISDDEYNAYYSESQVFLLEYIKETIQMLEEKKNEIVRRISEEISTLEPSEIIKTFCEYREFFETKKIKDYIDRIKEFRL